MQTRPRIHLIAACDARTGIGKNGTIPWDSRDDRRFFRAVTMGKPVLMGRVTYESIGKPLVGRRVLVLSSDPSFRPRPGDETATAVSSIEQAMDLAKDDEELMVAGGEQVYRDTLPIAKQVTITRVSGDFGCDRFFPEDLVGYSEIAYFYNPFCAVFTFLVNHPRPEGRGFWPRPSRMGSEASQLSVSASQAGRTRRLRRLRHRRFDG